MPIKDTSFKQLTLNGVVYNFRKRLGGGACAKVYSATTTEGQKVALKIFKRGKRASPFAFSLKNNHYGTTRDVNQTVFNEVKGKGNAHPFLIKFLLRAKTYRRWVLVTELAEGVSLGTFIEKNKGDIEAISKATFEFGRHLRQWHDADFAHGDPHLDNVMYDQGNATIRLVDLNMIHHPDFYYCKECCCFDRSKPANRFREDMKNDSRKVGSGFLTEIEELEKKISCGSALSQSFLKGYG
jgi:RIO-like serine/threonine protein kinase